VTISKGHVARTKKCNIYTIDRKISVLLKGLNKSTKKSQSTFLNITEPVIDENNLLGNMRHSLYEGDLQSLAT